MQLNLSEVTRTTKREINSVRYCMKYRIVPLYFVDSMEFEMPMYICSGMQIRFLRIVDRSRPAASPYRWVRYITHSDSYVFRV